MMVSVAGFVTQFPHQRFYAVQYPFNGLRIAAAPFLLCGQAADYAGRTRGETFALSEHVTIKRDAQFSEGRLEHFHRVIEYVFVAQLDPLPVGNDTFGLERQSVCHDPLPGADFFQRRPIVVAPAGRQEKRPFLLVGPGRWGSADPWLGIPVQWIDISGVAAIIEVRNDKIRADPSQGSHFFQNITSLGIPYLTLTENGDQKNGIRQDFLDWGWLKNRAVVGKTEYIQHVRLEEPFIMKCDGIQSESVLFTEMCPCETRCKIKGKEVYNQSAMQGVDEECEP